MKCIVNIALVLCFSLFLSACRQAPSSIQDQETGTATAALTLVPNTSIPIDTAAAPTLSWTPMAGEITAADNGGTFTITITSRISIILNKQDYPQANLLIQCQPTDALGGISNIPSVPDQYYVVRYEGVKPGVCTLRNGSFEVTVDIVSQP